jgi:hypothetical protein
MAEVTLTADVTPSTVTTTRGAAASLTATVNTEVAVLTAHTAVDSSKHATIH